MLAIVIPTYNEEAYIQKIIDELIDVRDKVNFDLIFVDDGSIDKSKEIIERNAKKYTWIRLLVHETNEGFAQSIKDGITFTLITVVPTHMLYTFHKFYSPTCFGEELWKET